MYFNVIIAIVKLLINYYGLFDIDVIKIIPKYLPITFG